MAVFEGAFGVEVSMDADLGVFGEVYESMGVISVEKWVDEERSGGEFWNEEEGEPLGLNNLHSIQTPRR